MTIQSHRDLLVWHKAMDLVIHCYELAKLFPVDEKYGLKSQLQRAAVSVPANIAEGRGRGTTNGFINHLWIASGSLAELDTHLEIAVKVHYVSEVQAKHIQAQIEEVGRMLVGLRRSLVSSST